MKNSIMKKMLSIVLVMALLLTVMPLSIAAGATEITSLSGTEESYINVYDAESLEIALATKGANIVLWGDVTYSEIATIVCNSLDLNGYKLTCTKKMIINSDVAFTILDSLYDSESQTSTGIITLSNGVYLSSPTFIIQSGVVVIDNGLVGSGDFKILDGNINISGTNGTDGVDGSNGTDGPDVYYSGYGYSDGSQGGNGTDGTDGYTAVSVENLFIYNGLVNITGGNAGNGGNGGNGGKGSSWLLSYEYGQSGNDGGYGGNGGNAGLSGCGVVATTSVYIYGGHNVIKGGDGGAGGNGGKGGNGGRCGNPEATTPHEGGKGGNGGNGGSNSHAGEGITSPKVIIAGGETMVWGGNSNPIGSAGICGSNGYGRNPGYPLNGSAGTCYGFGGAGINADLIISGGLVKTTGGTYASALGGSGYTSNKNGKAITVTGGKVIVQAGDKGFDIGGGYDGSSYGAPGTLEVSGGTIEFHTSGKATNATNPIYKNCIITGEGAYNHEGTYNENGKFSISVTDITINPADCVGYDSVTLTASLKISRSTNITTPAPKGYISFKIDGLEIGTAKIANAVASEGVITATATMDWIAVEGEKTITAEYVSGTNDQYASAGVFNYSSNITEHSHSWDSEFTVDLEPTCITKGSKSIHCNICHEKKFVEEIPFSDHTYINNKCSVCEGYKPLVVFKNYDGTILSSTYYNLGDTVVTPSNPSRPEDATYTYSFVGWNNDVVDCNGDAEYIAVYDSIYKNYTIIFNNYDGSELSKTTYHFGQKVTIPSIPTKPADALYFYTFAGWDKEVVNCAGDATYTAMFNSVPLSYLPTIKVGSYKAMAGETFTVEVMIENNLGFCYLELKPIFASELTLVDVENGILISDFTKGNQYLWVADEDITADGLLLKLTFSVAEDLAEGEYVIDFIVNLCGNYNEENVPITVQSGTISVVDFVYGDATGDGEVNGFDIIRLKKFLANYDEATGTSTVEISKGADATGDGDINGFDIIRLKKYIANYDEETGTSTVVLGPTN